MKPSIRPVLLSLIISWRFVAVSTSAQTAPPIPSRAEPFGIRIVDDATGRGVPLVELKTIDQSIYVTDNAGWVAFNEPGLMSRDIFFEITSHGYSFPKDGFGYPGKALITQPGGRVDLKIHRENIAERLCRLTGYGRFRDSRLLGLPVPEHAPPLNGDVVGQDTVQAAVYNGRIHWFWGDTNRPGYPLGQFQTSGATSPWPIHTDFDLANGIPFDYFTDDKGFSRPMIPSEKPGVIWLHGLFVLKEGDQERLIGHYARRKGLESPYEHGLVVYNDASDSFNILVEFDLDAALYPRGQALANEHTIDDYIYFCSPFPTIRVPADFDAIQSPENYEAWTPLRTGARYQDPNAVEIERDTQGNPIWDWRPNTDVLDWRRLRELNNHGVMEEMNPLTLKNADQAIHLQAGSVHWNAFRNKWVMIAEQVDGETSFLGEIWYAEADSLEGPWTHARHIVSHDHYSFYNPAHHPFLDQDNGRVIHFEGTYVTTFSQAKRPTPRYDYNQILYRLTLDDPKLDLD